MPESRQRGQGRSPEGGLTLIELVVTLVIIGITVAVALPAFASFGAGEDAGGAEPLRALLLQARHRSEVNASEVEVLLALSGRYRLTERKVGRETAVQEGNIRMPVDATDVASTAEPAPFRVVFRPIGIGVGDELAMDGRLVRVTAMGEISISR